MADSPQSTTDVDASPTVTPLQRSEAVLVDPRLMADPLQDNHFAIKVALSTTDVDAVPWSLSSSPRWDSTQADCHQSTALHQAADVGSDHTIRVILDTTHYPINGKDQYSLTPLHRAARNGHERVVRTLVQKGAWVSVIARRSNGVTPLHLAIHGGHVPTALLLINSNCNVYTEDDNGDTAMHVAARRGMHSIVLLLAQRLANVDAFNDNGFTPLHKAVGVLGGIRTMYTLLDYGANVSASDVSGLPESCRFPGNTPLHWAVIKGVPDAVQLLLERGADQSAKGSCGHTPLQLAANIMQHTYCNGNHNKVHALLVAHAASLAGRVEASHKSIKG
jgi:ankyrin repeat protein